MKNMGLMDKIGKTVNGIAKEFQEERKFKREIRHEEMKAEIPYKLKQKYGNKEAPKETRLIGWKDLDNKGQFNIGSLMIVAMTIIVAMIFMPVLVNFIAFGQAAVGATSMAGQVLGLITTCIAIAIVWGIFAKAQQPQYPV